MEQMEDIISMKKILVLFLLVVLCSSCRKYDYTTTITYRIYYPGNTVTKTHSHESTDKACYYLGSDRGSNYLYFNYVGTWMSGWGEKIEDTSAPIEIVSFVKTKK